MRPWMVLLLLLIPTILLGWWTSSRSKEEDRLYSSISPSQSHKPMPSPSASSKTAPSPFLLPGEEKLPRSLAIRRFGKSGASLRLKAFYPYHRGHEEFARYFSSLPDRFQDLEVVCVDFATKLGNVLFRQEGLSCGAVIVERKTEKGYQRVRVFSGPMSGSVCGDGEWGKQDLENLLRQLTQKEEH